MTKKNIIMFGMGPHAKRIYMPICYSLYEKHKIKIKVIVELTERADETMEYAKKFWPDTEFLFVDRFSDPIALPSTIEAKLDELKYKHNLTGAIIATNPLNHMQYALWAEHAGLHVLMDKPVSTRQDIATSLDSCYSLIEDLKMLKRERNSEKAFIINVQRRYNPCFQLVLNKIKEVARQYNMPVTAIQSSHCDGQWRLPDEILTQEYHPYYGWGKISHSGYHFTDIISQFILCSYYETRKYFDSISTFSSFIRPSGILLQQGQQDLVNIFGDSYANMDSRSDEQLLRLYKQANEAETDVSSVITLFRSNIPITNISLNLMHTGFSRRSWMHPGADLYKGNGRVKHEYHNIEQGPLQTIQIHSYQSKCDHSQNDSSDMEIGGNNHFDIFIYRNSDIIGGMPLQKISIGSFVDSHGFSSSKLFSESIKGNVVEEFLQIINGIRNPHDTLSDIESHDLSVALMSMLYESGTRRKEVYKEWKM